MANTKRRCLNCKDYHPVENGIKTGVGWFHSADCAAYYGLHKHLKQKAKADRADTKKRKEALKSKSDWLREAQQAFNKWVRLRDAGKACISCGRHHQGQYHAGHYRTVGSCPELRFEPLQVHKQCSPCNLHLSGNILEYRKRLIEVVGQEIVDWIEGPHEPKKYTIDQVKEIKKKYAGMARDLERSI